MVEQNKQSTLSTDTAASSESTESISVEVVSIEAEYTESAANPLDNAPAHIKLAVDLIYLLESSNISPQTALKALEIVKQDLESKYEF